MTPCFDRLGAGEVFPGAERDQAAGLDAHQPGWSRFGTGEAPGVDSIGTPYFILEPWTTGKRRRPNIPVKI
jgi:hypothetical protein